MSRNTSARVTSDRVTGAVETLFRLEGSRRIHQQQAAAAGINLSQLGLRLLGRVVESPTTSPGRLASLLDLDPAVVARLLRQLEEAGMIERRRSKSDGRVSSVSATAAGREAYSRWREVIWRQMRQALAGWDDADLDSLADYLERLVGDVQRHPYAPLEAADGFSRP